MYVVYFSKNFIYAELQIFWEGHKILFLIWRSKVIFASLNNDEQIVIWNEKQWN